MKTLPPALLLMFAAAGHASEVLEAPSHRPGLQLRLRHTASPRASDALPVLFVHGSSFPSALAFDFKMDGRSWMDQLAAQGYDVYALDFLGYGLSDRYPEMAAGSAQPVGRASEVYRDIAAAVDLVLQKTGKQKVLLIAHSWGGSVAALYAQKFLAKVAKLVLFAAVTAREETAARTTPAASFEELTPAQRIAGMNGLTPAPNRPQLHADVFRNWGADWLRSDRAGVHGGMATVRFRSGPSQDVDALRHGQAYYDPSQIRSPTLLIRGEWDVYPNDRDFTGLYQRLRNAPYKQYVVIPKGSHVMHLEAARLALYAEVLRFLDRAD